jgi:NAD-dependent dihydropyrimidine dehydrogenase PreA subunit
MLRVDKNKCNGDGVCSEVCAVGAANLNSAEGKAYIDSDMCIECYTCMNTCPQEAIYEED